MTVHVDGVDANDCARQIYKSVGHKNAWLSVDPAQGGDFGHIPTQGFIVRWQGREENFTRKVGSVAELFEVLRPIVVEQDKRVKAKIREEAQKRAAEHRASLKAAKKEVKRLEAAQK